MMASVPDTYWLLILQHEGHMCQISRIGLAYNWLYCSILNQKSIILSKNYNLSRFKQNFKRAQISCFLTKFYEIWNYSSKLSILTGHWQKNLILCIQAHFYRGVHCTPSPLKNELKCKKSRIFVNDLLVYSILSYNSKFHKIWLKNSWSWPFWSFA